MSHVILNEWLYLFIARIINIHGSSVLITLFSSCMAGGTWNCCCLGTSSVHTIQSCTNLQWRFIKSHIGRVLSCNLPPPLLVEWPGSFTCYCGNTGMEQVQSQHRNLTLEKKIHPLLLPGLEPGTFPSRVRRSNHWAVPVLHNCPYFSLYLFQSLFTVLILDWS